jgi:protein TonB
MPRAWRPALLAACVVLASGCAQRHRAPGPEPMPPPVPAAPSTPQAAAVAPASAGASRAGSVDAYKRELADLIHQVAAAQVYAGAPPPALRSVVVMSLSVDASGNLAEVKVVRDNGDDEATRAALASARGAAPFPRPAPRLLRRGLVQVMESWLFRDDGKFRLRTLSEAQQQE